MSVKTETRKYTIDATGKRLGRVASEAASLLLGKDQTDFAKNVVAPVEVIITNASKLNIDPKKFETKEYKRFSGYPSGLKIETMSEVVGKKGYKEIVKKAVNGMLPKNKLRKIRIMNLKVSE